MKGKQVVVLDYLQQLDRLALISVARRYIGAPCDEFIAMMHSIFGVELGVPDTDFFALNEPNVIDMEPSVESAQTHELFDDRMYRLYRPFMGVKLVLDDGAKIANRDISLVRMHYYIDRMLKVYEISFTLIESCGLADALVEYYGKPTIDATFVGLQATPTLIFPTQNDIGISVPAYALNNETMMPFSVRIFDGADRSSTNTPLMDALDLELESYVAGDRA